MVNFENGTLVKGAYVVIDGKEYEVHMPEYSGNTPLNSENMNKLQTDILQAVFPVGATYITQDADTNPNSVLGFGTWERFKGKIALGVDEDDANLSTIGNAGGEKTHTLTVNEMPPHIHNIDKGSGGIWVYGVNDTMLGNGVSGNWAHKIDGDTQATGGGQAHNNMQPYEIVGYMWIRRA